MNMGILCKGESFESYSSNMEDCSSIGGGGMYPSAATIPTPLTSGEHSGSEWAMGSTDLPPLCAGCRLRIVDDFYLSSVEKKWHASCLRCSECGGELEDQASCFERDGHIYCREDFLKLQSSARSCAKCCSHIRASDLVMKARECYFHVDCFRCATCDTTLVKGDLFGMVSSVLFCKDHYEDEEDLEGELEEEFEEELEDLDEGPGYPMGGSGVYPVGVYPPYDWQAPYESAPGAPWGPYHPPGHPHPNASFPPFENNNKPPPGVNSSSFKKRRGRKKRPKMITGEGFPAEGVVYDNNPLGPAGSTPLDPLGGGGNQPKTKRARTSFKHHQLRIMKAHFQINQNPDSRELKMLSQKTGLDKKVLQVWFQNSRAKWRRTKTQDGVPPSGPEDHMGLGDASSPASDCSGNGPLIPCC